MDAPERQQDVPTGLEHLNFLQRLNKSNRLDSEPILRNYKKHLTVLGTAMAGLYTSATCHRVCRGGDHIIETLGTRTYNLSLGAYSLASIGLYDEALNLVRNIGEIANLLSLSLSDKHKLEEWITSTKSERIQKFSPVKIRKLLEESRGIVLMDQSWYAELCESSTHINPGITPNKYDSRRSVCGGLIQPEGTRTAIEQLTEIVALTSLYFCRYSDLDDIFEKISLELRAVDED